MKTMRTTTISKAAKAQHMIRKAAYMATNETATNRTINCMDLNLLYDCKTRLEDLRRRYT